MRKLNLTTEERRLHDNEIKRKSRMKHKEAINRKRREHYAAHKGERKEYHHQWYLKNKERVRLQSKIRYYNDMNDPIRYAIRTENARLWRERNRDKVNAKRNEWRKQHKKLYRRQMRLENDRRNMRFRMSAELYAEYLIKRRKYNAAYIRKKNPTIRCYKPKKSLQTPLGCTFGNVLDRRSVFIWNNAPAASLIAGRVFEAEKWRQIHCDRFGEVCR